MILQSTIERILPQLAAICDELRLVDSERKGIFYAREGKDLPHVAVVVGDLANDTRHILTFDSFGRFQSCVYTWIDCHDGNTIRSESVNLKTNTVQDDLSQVHESVT